MNNNSRWLLTAALILTVLAITVVANLITREAVAKFSLKADLTDNKLYELSDTTRQIAENISAPVIVTVFSKETDYPVMVREILARYAGLNRNIMIEYRDLYENPLLADSYHQKGFTIAENDIVVNGKSKIKQIKTDDLYVFNSAKTKIKGFRAEQVLSSALVFTNDSSELRVEFTDGHGEKPSAGLMTIFQDNNFELGRITLGVMNISENTDLLVIAAPERDFQKEEIVKLEEYLGNGGKLLVFAGPSVNRLVNFEEFLKKWGIELTGEVVFEEKAFLSNNPINIVPMYAPHPINQYFADKRIFLVSPATRALSKAEQQGYELDIMPVLTSSPDSYAKTGKEFDSAQRNAEDVSGPFLLAVSSEREIMENGGEALAKVLVIGSRSFYGDDVLGKSSYANADFLVQSINWLVEKNNGISIAVKNIEADPINVLPDTVWTIGIIVIGIVPAMIVLAGIVVCMRRKRL